MDDLTDEMRRYREFLGHEKTRRVPALYKTTNAEPLSVYNESICRLIDSLTSQLTLVSFSFEIDHFELRELN